MHVSVYAAPPRKLPADILLTLMALQLQLILSNCSISVDYTLILRILFPFSIRTSYKKFQIGSVFIRGSSIFAVWYWLKQIDLGKKTENKDKYFLFSFKIHM